MYSFMKTEQHFMGFTPNSNTSRFHSPTGTKQANKSNLLTRLLFHLQRLQPQCPVRPPHPKSQGERTVQSRPKSLARPPAPSSGGASLGPGPAHLGSGPAHLGSGPRPPRLGRPGVNREGSARWEQ